MPLSDRHWQARRLPHNGLGSQPNNALNFQQEEPLKLWIYRAFRDRSGRYAIREVFYEHDGRLISYGKHPVAPLGPHIQLVQWYR